MEFFWFAFHKCENPNYSTNSHMKSSSVFFSCSKDVANMWINMTSMSTYIITTNWGTHPQEFNFPFINFSKQLVWCTTNPMKSPLTQKSERCVGWKMLLYFVACVRNEKGKLCTMPHPENKTIHSTFSIIPPNIQFSHFHGNNTYTNEAKEEKKNVKIISHSVSLVGWRVGGWFSRLGLGWKTLRLFWCDNKLWMFHHFMRKRKILGLASFWIKIKSQSKT